MKNDLDFYKMAKRTLHEMFKDPEERKELEKLMLKYLIKYAIKTGYKA